MEVSMKKYFYLLLLPSLLIQSYLTECLTHKRLWKTSLLTGATIAYLLPAYRIHRILNERKIEEEEQQLNQVNPSELNLFQMIGFGISKFNLEIKKSPIGTLSAYATDKNKFQIDNPRATLSFDTRLRMKAGLAYTGLAAGCLYAFKYLW